MCKDRKRKREAQQKRLIDCLSKISYATKHIAEGYAKLLRKKYPNSLQRVYHCPLCGKYHLTSQIEYKKENKKTD